ncbi:hypothetical protein B1C78_13095 [Thioalkalivibrio denitrificans]|uniref:PDZ domain-containing protein n=1 Tax=Thioalkalivibrio denitrificans TaxID=108003 RepID=A0A1V3NDW5_9GAMM|nr:PDZ domain-containing protein [Thioalkalivibrio denitrificans]OOG22986.1 hypothetical protein B1C78_13095 [Thioalkalivibrio denitrificans]
MKSAIRPIIVLATVALLAGCLATLPGAPSGSAARPTAQSEPFADGVYPTQASNPQRLEYDNGAVYVGDVRNGRPAGYGVMTWPDGGRYEGTYHNGVRWGRGRLDRADGGWYQGGYRDNRRHGQGEAHNADGTVDQGRFHEGNFVTGTRRLVDGTTITGPFEDGKPSGNVTVQDTEGVVYVGRYLEDGAREGLYVRVLGAEDDYYEVWRGNQPVFTTLGPNRLAATEPLDCRVESVGDEVRFQLIQGGCAEGLAQGEGVALGEDRRVLLDGRFEAGRLVEGARMVLPRPHDGLLGVWFKARTEEDGTVPVRVGGQIRARKVDGLEISGFMENSGAEAAGMQVGDIIVAVNGVTHGSDSDVFLEEVRDRRAGDVIRVDFLRPGPHEPQSVDVRLNPPGVHQRITMALGRVPDPSQVQTMEQRAPIRVTAAQAEHELPADLAVGMWEGDALHGDAQVYQAAMRIYDGGTHYGALHGQGVCLVEGSPQRCEHHRGARVDTAYLLARLNADLARADAEYRERMERIEARIESERQHHRRMYEGTIASIDREIRNRQNHNVAQGLIRGIAPSMQGNRAETQRITAETRRVVDRLEREKEQRTADFMREQEQMEREWQREREHEMYEAEQRHRDDVSHIIARHQGYCEGLPGRWFNGNHECVYHRE